ncbi:MAG: amidase family protein, partial [Anaerolineae bacterium]
SAVAVAAGYCHLALGSQTIGSMIRPAAFCGIVGSKPTFGRVPTSGVLPFSESADTVGVFTQDVSGNALALAVVTDGWRSAGGWSTADGRRSADGGASRAGANTSADRPVLGVPEGPYLEQAPDATRDAFEGHVAALEGAGYQVRRVRLFDDIEEVNVRHRRMAAAEMAAAHAEWFAQYGSRYRPRTAEFLRLGQTVGAAELAAARAGRAKLRDEIEAAAAAAGVDVWLSPSAPGPAPEGLASTGDPIMNLPWTHAGLPTLTVPAASPFELPLGLQLSAGWMRDEPLFEWAGPIAAVVGPG